MLQTKASLHKRLERVSLPVQRVNNVGSGLDQGCLEHVGEQGQDAVQRLELDVGDLFFGNVGRGELSVGDSGHKFREDG